MWCKKLEFDADFKHMLNKLQKSSPGKKVRAKKLLKTVIVVKTPFFHHFSVDNFF
jgi:hypothetical protein